jgi:hypothetical protein
MWGLYGGGGGGAAGACLGGVGEGFGWLGWLTTKDEIEHIIIALIA